MFGVRSIPNTEQASIGPASDEVAPASTGRTAQVGTVLAVAAICLAVLPAARGQLTAPVSLQH